MVRLGKITIDGELRQQRPRHLRQRLGKQKQQRYEHRAAVAPQVADQPSHQPAIISFAENFFFHGGYKSSVTQSTRGRPRRSRTWLVLDLAVLSAATRAGA